MKRLPPELRIKRVRHDRRRQRSDARRRLPKLRRQERLAALLAAHRDRLPFNPINAGRLPLLVPEVLSLRTNYAETAAFIASIRQYALDQFIPIDLYFDKVREVEVGALTVLTAEIQRCRFLRRVGGKLLVGGTYPQDAQVYNQLKGLGFFRLLHIAENSAHGEDDGDAAKTRVVLPFLTDAEVTPERTDTFLDTLVSAIKDTVEMDERSQRYLYGAIIEAMKNAGEHAYKLPSSHQRLKRRWWLTAALDLGLREVSISLFDQGVGIPLTLEADLRAIAESVANLEGFSPPDSLLIEIATRTGRTSTHQAGRGQGFRTMRKFVDACDDGELLVYSNSGLYMYARSGASRADEPVSLGGTLIQWRFRHSTALTDVDQ